MSKEKRDDDFIHFRSPKFQVALQTETFLVMTIHLPSVCMCSGALICVENRDILSFLPTLKQFKRLIFVQCIDTHIKDVYSLENPKSVDDHIKLLVFKPSNSLEFFNVILLNCKESSIYHTKQPSFLFFAVDNYSISFEFVLLFAII